MLATPFSAALDARSEDLDEQFLWAVITCLPYGKAHEGVNALGAVLAARPSRALTKTEEALLSFVLSAACYRRAGEHKSHSFQLTKVLYVLREYLALHRATLTPQMVVALEREVVRRAIRGVHRAFGATHRVEIEQYQEVLERDANAAERGHNVRLYEVSLSFEVREIVIAFEEIKLKVDDHTPLEQRLKPSPWLLQPYRFVSPFAVVNSVYNRIHELRFRGNVNYRNLCYSASTASITTRQPGWDTWRCC